MASLSAPSAASVAEELRQNLPAGAATSHVRVDQAATGEDDGRCLRARGAVKRDALVMRVPVAHAIGSRSLGELLGGPGALENSPLSLLFDADAAVQATACSLTRRLSGGLAARRAYVATLPKSFKHMPTEWTNADDRLTACCAHVRNFCTRLQNEIDVALLDIAPVLEYLIKSRPELFPKAASRYSREIGWHGDMPTSEQEL